MRKESLFEDFFGDVGVQEAYADGKNGYAAVVGIFVFDFIETFAQKQSYENGNDEKADDF